MSETNPLEIIRQQKQNCDTALEAARTEKECLEETKKAVFEAAEKHAQAYIPEEEEKRFLRNIRQTPCAVPTSAQLTPVLKESFREVAPEIKYKLVISSKKIFWIGAVLIVLSGLQTFFFVKDKNSFDGTAESWANRMYLANVELYEKNPGAGYDEIMKDFANGNAENAKEKVVRKENKLSEIQNHRRKYEKKISEFLAKDFPSGVRIVELEETTGQRYTVGFGGKRKSTNYNFVYARIFTLDENCEFRVAMEREEGFPLEREPWDVYITEDKRINSVADYRKKASAIHWEYAKKKAIQ